VPQEFNLNDFWHTIIGNYQYDASHFKGIIIRNRCIRLAQRVLAFGLFAWKDSLNVPHLFELYFLHSMLQWIYMDPISFLANQLLNASTISAKRIVLAGFIIPMARPKRLALAAFEQMKFFTVDGGRTCWIYPGNRLLHLPNVDRTTLLNPDNLSFMVGDESWFILDTHLILHPT